MAPSAKTTPCNSRSKRPSSPLSPIALQQREERRIVQQAHRRMLQKKYKEALALANDFLTQQLVDDWEGPLTYFQTTVQLTVPLQLEPIIPPKVAPNSRNVSNTMGGQDESDTSAMSFQVRLGTQLKTVDELAVIALQCWHELFLLHQKSHASAAPVDVDVWTYIHPVLQIYAKHPMPIQVFVEVWIPFWLQSRYHPPTPSPSLALAWNWQVAGLLLRRNQTHGADPLQRQWLNQSVQTLFTLQLPRVRDPSLAKQLAQVLLDRTEDKGQGPSSPSWSHLLEQLNDKAVGTTDNPRSVQQLSTLLRSQQHQASQDEPRLLPSGLALQCLEHILQHDCYQASQSSRNVAGLGHSEEAELLGTNLSTGHDPTVQRGMIPWVHRCLRNLTPQPRSIAAIPQMLFSLLNGPGSRTSSRQSSVWERTVVVGRQVLSFSAFVYLLLRYRRMWAKIATPVLLAVWAPMAELFEALGIPLPPRPTLPRAISALWSATNTPTNQR
eukprot:Nitzschia sp. Nitz4//scaffold279_size24496//22400//23887//NITZ4_008386-RA/size24496-processed-gene-0.24-mRNA-1//-1//CDS//3329545409//1272//frame0